MGESGRSLPGLIPTRQCLPPPRRLGSSPAGSPLVHRRARCLTNTSKPAKVRGNPYRSYRTVGRGTRLPATGGSAGSAGSAHSVDVHQLRPHGIYPVVDLVVV